MKVLHSGKAELELLHRSQCHGMIERKLVCVCQGGSKRVYDFKHLIPRWALCWILKHKFNRIKFEQSVLGQSKHPRLQLEAWESALGTLVSIHSPHNRRTL